MLTFDTAPLRAAFDSLSGRSLILFGGKGGVGKTTISSLAALHFSTQQPVVLFSSDPAANLSDLFAGESVPGLTIEQLDAGALYRAWLDRNIDSFLELGDRGTYLDKDELGRFLELALPGIDELMSWLHIGDLVRANPASTVIVDSAPTGHTLRMLGSSAHFTQFGEALEAMQSKHRDLVRQLTRRRVRDAMDEFIDRFRRDAEERLELLTDAARSCFIPVLLAEPWVIEQTARLSREVRALGVDVPFQVLNRAVSGCECPRCTARAGVERGIDAVRAPRSCVPLDSVERLREYLSGTEPTVALHDTVEISTAPLPIDPAIRLLFVAGKGGVGKTSTSASIALQLAGERPGHTITVISVDPAHGLADAIGSAELPSNLRMELVDTPGEWRTLRDRLGDEIERAIGGLTGGGVHIAHDAGVMRQLVEIAPPGADELFAIMRLHELLGDAANEVIIVDTAPTGHFLRLLDLPATAGEWVREFMRILLRYKDLIPPSTLGQQLVRASKALHAFEALLRSNECAAVVVTRPERIVVAETRRLIDDLASRGIALAGLVANYVAPPGECRCDRIRRAAEEIALTALARPVTLVHEREAPVTDPDGLRTLVPISHTAR
jgi:arsenite-transporting ATPase